MSRLLLVISILIFVCSSCVDNKREKEMVFYVSVNGDNNNSGTLNKPFKSLEKARDTIRKLKKANKINSSVKVRLLAGEYMLRKPFILKPDDSGTKGHPIIYEAYNDDEVIISGGVKIVDWEPTELNGHKVLVADLTTIEEHGPFEQLWVNGHRAIQARVPNTGYLRALFDDSIIKNMAQGLNGEADRLSYISDDEHYFDGLTEGVVVAFYKWLEYHLPFDRIDREKDQIVFKAKTMRPVETDEKYYLEGGKEMLDYPGEWYLDRENKKLYYYPLEDETDVQAVIPVLENVLRIE